MQIAGYTFLNNHEEYLEFVEDMKECYREEFKNFYLSEPKKYPTMINLAVDGGTLCDIHYVEEIKYDELKELYNHLHRIFSKEN